MFIQVPDKIAKQLEELADQEGASVAELLDRLLKRYTADTVSGSLAALAQNAKEAGLVSDQAVDTVARSREILRREGADQMHKGKKGGILALK
jgi:hypothetical protein